MSINRTIGRVVGGGVLAFLSVVLQAQVAEVVVDNGDAGTSSTGIWHSSGGTDPYDPADPSASSLWARDGATYTWSFIPPAAGTFAVSMWWSGYASRATSIPVEITHFGGATSMMINQQTNPGAWNSLGEYYFDGAGSVTMTAAFGSSLSTCADAIRFSHIAGVPTEVIIDNQSLNTAQTGSWYESGAPDPYAVDSVWSRDGATFSFVFTAPESGDYQLSMWWTEWPSRGENVPVTVENANSSDTVFINQKTNGGQWNVLGTYLFSVGETYNVTITSLSGPASTCADAVKFEYVEERKLDYVVIEGLESVSENTVVQYRCKAYYTNGSQAFVDGAWDVLNGPVAIDANGLLTAGNVGSDTPFEIHVSYMEDGVVREASKSGVVKVFVPPDEIIVDNGDPETSSTGAWYDSSALGPYGAQSLWSRDGATYTWSFIAPVAAYYKIDMWWTEYESRSSQVPVHIQRTGAETLSLEINQQENGSQWNPLAILFLEAGVQVDVTVVAQPGPSSTCADAVRFSFSGPPAPERLDITGPMSVDKNTTAQYTCVAYFTGGTSEEVAADSWTLDIDSATAEISSTGLLSAYETTGDVECRVSASYTAGGKTETGELRIFIRDVVPPVVVDNGSPDTSSSGTWDVSGASDPYGDDSLYSRNGATYTWSFEPVVNGFYEVQMWWTHLPSRTSAGKVTIQHADGQATRYIDQRSNGGRWNLVDVFRFESGGRYQVTITASDGSSSTCADAVRFVNVPAPEHIFACPGYASVDATPEIVAVMEELNATELNPDLWTYKNNSLNQHYVVHIIHDIERMKQALMTEDAHVIYFGHSNYGLGALFTDAHEFRTQVVEDIYYVDDPRIFNYSSSMVRISVRGMRTGQAYPSWWPIFQDGASALMPYEHGDPRGDPPYNYYVSYQIPGDPSGTHYKIDSPRYAPIERFPDAEVPAWFSPDGSLPDADNPDHLQFFITNSTDWKPSFEFAGDWYQSMTIAGYWLEDYYYTQAGGGENWAKWMFDVPTAGEYEVFAWWSASSSRTPDAPYTIAHAGGETTVRMDQRYNGGTWNSLGLFAFDVGAYAVTLTNDAASGSVAADGIRITHSANPPDIIKAQPYARVREGQAPYEIIMRHDSTGDHTERHWVFGDGHTNQTRDTSEHTYAASGNYTVTLTITGPAGSDTVTLEEYIRITEGPDEPERLMAEFSAYGEEGEIPRQVRFRDYSSGDLREGVTYTPELGVTGTDEFTYTVLDESGLVSNEVTVTVLVNPPNAAPYARDDEARAIAGISRSLQVTGNDLDTDDDLSLETLAVTGGPSNGTAEPGDTGRIDYTANAGFSGVDQFTYTVADELGNVSNEAIVTVAVFVDNLPPIARDDVVSAADVLTEPLGINVADNDFDEDGDVYPNTIVITTPPSIGTVDVTDAGRVIFTPPPGFTGVETFFYTLQDDAGAVSNEARVTIRIAAGEVPPVAVSDWAATRENSPVTIDILGNDRDLDNSLDPGSIIVTNAPAVGSVVVHDCWFWEFGDGTTSHQQQPTHIYTEPGIYDVRLTVTDVNGSTNVKERPQYVRTTVYEKFIDNVDYPKTHFGNKVIVWGHQNEPEITPDDMKYKRLLYVGCDSGHYFTDTFQRGLMFYAMQSSATGAASIPLYLRAYLQGKTDHQIWEILQNLASIFDYYDFTKTPEEQP